MQANPFLYATIHEFQMVQGSDRLAKITASFTQSHLDQETAHAALQERLGRDMVPVRSSFRWLDDDRRESVIGFVFAPQPTEFLPGGALPKQYRQIAANIYMDETDESMWDMRDGVGGKYLARQGAEDLRDMLERARVSPRGSQPRMAHILQASVSSKELISFVSESRRTASVDHGVVLSTGENGALHVLSHMTGEPIVVASDRVIASYTIDSKGVPALPKEKIKAALALRPKPVTAAARVNAADVYDPHLTPEEYWKLQYSYNPEYLNKVLQQVAEMAAL